MVEKIAGQAGPFAQPVFFYQLATGVTGGKVKRLLVAHVAGNVELQNQRLQAGNRVKAGAIGPRGPLKTIGLGQLHQGLIDFPQQHRCRGRSAAAARQFTIEDDDRKTLPGQPLGEDSEEIVEPDVRDQAIPEKSRALAKRLAALWPAANADIEFRWSGTFDTTSDGLPLIGPVPGAKGVYAAYGYGGNGITFSFIASQLIGDLIAGETSPLLGDFALDRDGPAAY